MTMPASSQSPALRTHRTEPAGPATGRRPAPHRPGTRRQNAFAQALAQANAQNQAFRNQINVAPPGQAGAAHAVRAAGADSRSSSRRCALSVRSESNGPSSTRARRRPPPPSRCPGGFGPMVNQAAKKYGVDPALIAAVMETESKFNPDAVSQAGARGLMQLMPATARGLGVTDASDPLQNDPGRRQAAGPVDREVQGQPRADAGRLQRRQRRRRQARRHPAVRRDPQVRPAGARRRTSGSRPRPARQPQPRQPSRRPGGRSWSLPTPRTTG